MTPVTKSEWQAWKADPITRAFYQASYERIAEVKDILANYAGIDSVNDNFNRGFIRAYVEMLDFRVDDLQEDDNA